MKRPKGTDLRKREAEADRVRFLLNNLYGGNQSRMAAAVPASQSLLSKIDRGDRLPGRDLMEKLAQLAGVNPGWVLRGEGEPFSGPSKGTLPIAVGVLPGWPERYTELLTGQRHPVAEALDRASRYWVQVAAGCPLARKA